MSYNPIDRPKIITKDIRISYILDKQIYLWALPNGVIAITPYILATYDKDDNLTLKVPFWFAGGLYDSDTKLIRFGYRDYDSYTGK